MPPAGRPGYPSIDVLTWRDSIQPISTIRDLEEIMATCKCTNPAHSHKGPCGIEAEPDKALCKDCREKNAAKAMGTIGQDQGTPRK
jgi:hypothetical protein